MAWGAHLAPSTYCRHIARSATRSINELAADGLNCSGSKCLRLDGQDLQFGDLLDKLHWSLEFAVQADLAVTLGAVGAKLVDR